MSLSNVMILGTPPVLGLLSHAAWKADDRDLWDACALGEDWEAREREAALRALDYVDDEDKVTELGDAASELLHVLLVSGATLARPPTPERDESPEPTG